MSLPDAKTVNYWNTGRSDPDTWLLKTRALIEGIGGVVTGEAYGRTVWDGQVRSGYQLSFVIEEEEYRIEWPVLPHDPSDEVTAKRQAVTYIYHDVKARCMRSLVLGPRFGFFEFLVLENNQTVGRLSNAELQESIPRITCEPDVPRIGGPTQ